MTLALSAAGLQFVTERHLATFTSIGPAGVPQSLETGAGGVEEVAPEPVGGGQFVAGQGTGEQAVAVAGEHGEGGVEVDVEL